LRASSEAFVRFGVVMAADYLLAAALYPALRHREAVRRIAAQVIIALAIAMLPFFVPPRAKLLRFGAAVWAVTLIVKTYDVGAAARDGAAPPLGQYLAHLPNGLLLIRRRPPESSWTAGKNLTLLVRRAAGGAMAIGLCVIIFRADWAGRSFWVEHAAKVVPFYFALINVTGAIAAGWRLLGGTALDPFGHPAAAATPAEFWRRWNRPTAQWFQQHVFYPAGGVAHPIRATLATFAVSAIVHEYVFGIPVGRVQGFQTAFFMIQGVAVVATARTRPGGWRRFAWGVGTFAFMLGTSVLFFASMNHVVRMYGQPLPGWLGTWDRWTST
jgi:MBOAT, membrane-bound O-acyltransferase family